MTPKVSILKPEDPLIRRVCKSYEGKVTDLHRNIISQMKQLMYANNGIGLAAAQVGFPWRVFVMNITGALKDELVFINPKIIEKSGDIVEFPEGCLTLPGVFGPVDRHQKVKVEAQDIDGNTFVIEDDGIAARCMLHEIDHLDGILFIDKAKKLYKGLDPL